MFKNVYYIFCFVLAVFNCSAFEPAPYKPVYDPNVTLWVGHKDTTLCGCKGDGTIMAYDINKEDQVSVFSISGYEYARDKLYFLDTNKLIRIRYIESYCKLELYELTRGILVSTVTLPISEIYEIKLGTKNNNFIIFTAGKIYYLDLNNLQIVKEVSVRTDSMQSDTHFISPDGDCIFMISQDQLSLKGINGTILWSNVMGINGSYELAVQQPDWPFVLLFEEGLERKNRFCLLDIINGKFIWAKECGYKALGGISSNTAVQAWNIDQELMFTCLPTQKTVNIPDVKGPFDVFFYCEDNLAICVPKLKVGADNLVDKSYTLSRDDKVIIINYSRAKMIKELHPWLLTKKDP